MDRDCEGERLDGEDSGGRGSGNEASGAGGSLRVFTSAACELSSGSPRESHTVLVLRIWIAKRTGLQASHMLIKKLIKTHEFLRTYGLFKVDPRLMLS